MINLRPTALLPVFFEAAVQAPTATFPVLAAVARPILTDFDGRKGVAELSIGARGRRCRPDRCNPGADRPDARRRWGRNRQDRSGASAWLAQTPRARPCGRSPVTARRDCAIALHSRLVETARRSVGRTCELVEAPAGLADAAILMAATPAGFLHIVRHIQQGSRENYGINDRLEHLDRVPDTHARDRPPAQTVRSP